MGPQLLELAGDEDAFVDFDASFESVAHVGLDDDSHVVTGRLHHLLHAHAHEAHAVVERTAVLVATVVGIGREELADEVAVSGVNLYGIESGIAGVVDRLAEGTGHRLDFVLVHASYEGGRVEVESGRGRDGYLPGRAAVRHVAAVPQLDGGFGSLGMNGVGDAAQRFHDFGAHPQLVFEREPVAGNRGVGERGHAYAAGSHAAVVVIQFLGRGVVVAHPFEGGRPYGAVAQGDGPYRGRCKEYGLFGSGIVVHDFNR